MHAEMNKRKASRNEGGMESSRRSTISSTNKKIDMR